MPDDVLVGLNHHIGEALSCVALRASMLHRRFAKGDQPRGMLIVERTRVAETERIIVKALVQGIGEKCVHGPVLLKDSRALQLPQEALH